MSETIVFDKDLHRSKAEGEVELAKPLREEVQTLMHKLVKLYPQNEEKGWLLTKAPVDSLIIASAPESDTFTYVEVRSPKDDNDQPGAYVELVYFEETEYEDDTSERLDLITMKFDRLSPVVGLEIHDPAVRKRYLGLLSVDNSLGIEISDDLKHSCRQIEAPRIGELALAQTAA